MTRKLPAVPAVILCLALAAGCVERTMMIRSEPPGAPVWVDEEYAGTTPLDYSFAHYGTRGVRVGPIRDETGKARYAPQERLVRLRAPWYQVFPVDFFAEVLWPGRIHDRHEVPVFELQPPPDPVELYGEGATEKLLEAGEEFRSRALDPAPDLLPQE